MRTMWVSEYPKWHPLTLTLRHDLLVQVLFAERGKQHSMEEHRWQLYSNGSWWHCFSANRYWKWTKHWKCSVGSQRRYSDKGMSPCICQHIFLLGLSDKMLPVNSGMTSFRLRPLYCGRWTSVMYSPHPPLRSAASPDTPVARIGASLTLEMIGCMDTGMAMLGFHGMKAGKQR